MKKSIKIKLNRLYVELVVEYLERCIQNYAPDHNDVNLALRMAILVKLRTRLAKRQTEFFYSGSLSITIPKEEGLALLAQYLDDDSGIYITTDAALKKITGVAHKEWM